jgi:hypothetical protein
MLLIFLYELKRQTRLLFIKLFNANNSLGLEQVLKLYISFFRINTEDNAIFFKKKVKILTHLLF